MIYRFGSYSLDPDRLELRDNEALVPVEPQVFALLAFLLIHRDKVVTKDEIIDAVWDGRIVSDGTLNSRINAARRALGDDGQVQEVIKTFPRRGFRFIAEVDDDIEPAQTLTPAFHATNKPSIAVLPFDNLSGDPEQEYFSDGITGDIITALGRIRQFSVIARNTTFTYKGQSVDVQATAKELGVRYVLEGSVRKAVARVRVTAQLNDGVSGNYIWAEHFDRDLADIFAVQDEITQRVVAAIEPTMAKVERDRANIKNPENLDAWDYYHRGMSHLFDKGEYGQPDEMILARVDFLKSIELDSNFARAQSGLATCLFYSYIIGPAKDLSQTLEEAFVAAKKAIELDQEDAYGHGILGLIHLHNRDTEAAIRECRTAIENDPNFLLGYFWMGTAMICSGDAPNGIGHIQMALRIGKRVEHRGPAMVWMAMGYLFLGEYELSADWAQKALGIPNTQFWGNAALTAALSYLERMDDALRARQELQRRKPDYTCAFVKNRSPITDQDHLEILLDGLRKAGVSEE